MSLRGLRVTEAIATGADGSNCRETALPCPGQVDRQPRVLDAIGLVRGAIGHSNAVSLRGFGGNGSDRPLYTLHPRISQNFLKVIHGKISLWLNIRAILPDRDRLVPGFSEIRQH